MKIPVKPTSALTQIASCFKHKRRTNEKQKERKSLIEYGRFSLVDKADNQLVKMLMHSPQCAPASRDRLVVRFSDGQATLWACLPV